MVWLSVNPMMQIRPRNELHMQTKNIFFIKIGKVTRSQDWLEGTHTNVTETCKSVSYIHMNRGVGVSIWDIYIYLLYCLALGSVSLLIALVTDLSSLYHGHLPYILYFNWQRSSHQLAQRNQPSDVPSRTFTPSAPLSGGLSTNYQKYAGSHTWFRNKLILN